MVICRTQHYMADISHTRYHPRCLVITVMYNQQPTQTLRCEAFRNAPNAQPGLLRSMSLNSAIIHTIFHTHMGRREMRSTLALCTTMHTPCPLPTSFPFTACLQAQPSPMFLYPFSLPSLVRTHPPVCACSVLLLCIYPRTHMHTGRQHICSDSVTFRVVDRESYWVSALRRLK